MRGYAHFITVAELVGLGWALGLGLCTSLLFCLYLLHMLTTPLVFVAGGASLLLTFLGLLALSKGRSYETTFPGNSPFVAYAGLAVAAVQVAYTARTAWFAPLTGYDAWAMWSLKARMFAMGGPALSYFTHPAYSHPDYPLNLPLTESIAFRLPNALGIPLAAEIGPTCFAALLLVFFGVLGRLYGPSIAGVSTALLALIPALPFQSALGYADVPLTMYIGAASVFFVAWRHTRSSLDALIFGLCLGGALWTKKEGTLFAVLMLALLTFTLVRPVVQGLGGRLRTIGVVVAATLAIPLPWLIFSALTHFQGGDFLPLTSATLESNISRLPTIALFFYSDMMRLVDFSLFWPLLFVAVVVALPRLSATGILLLALLVLIISLDAGTYIFSVWNPYTVHLANSSNRLLLQTTPLAVLVLVEAALAWSRPWTRRGRRNGQSVIDIGSTKTHLI